jgi:hypothetical protein
MSAITELQYSRSALTALLLPTPAVRLDNSRFKDFKDFTESEVKTAFTYIFLWSEHNCVNSYNDVWQKLLWRLLWYSKKSFGGAPARIDCKKYSQYVLILHMLSVMIRKVYRECYDKVRKEENTPLAFKKIDVIADLMAVRLLRRTLAGPKTFLSSSMISGGVVDATRSYIETESTAGCAVQMAKAILRPVFDELRSTQSPLRVIRMCMGCAVSVITCALVDGAEENTSGERDFPWFNRPVLLSSMNQGLGYGRCRGNNVSADNHCIKIVFEGFVEMKHGVRKPRRCIIAHVSKDTAMRNVLSKVMELYPDAAAFLNTFKAAHKLYWPGTSDDLKRLPADGPLRTETHRVDVVLEAWMQSDVQELDVPMLEKAALARIDAVQHTAALCKGSHFIVEMPASHSGMTRLTYKLKHVNDDNKFKLSIAATIFKAKKRLLRHLHSRSTGFSSSTAFPRSKELNFYKNYAAITAHIE